MSAVPDRVTAVPERVTAVPDRVSAVPDRVIAVPDRVIAVPGPPNGQSPSAGGQLCYGSVKKLWIFGRTA